MNSDERKKAAVLALGIAGIVGLTIRGVMQARNAGSTGASSSRHPRRSTATGGSGRSGTTPNGKEDVVDDVRHPPQQTSTPIQATGNAATNSSPPDEEVHTGPESPFTGNSLDEEYSNRGEGPESELELQFRLDGFRIKSPVQAPTNNRNAGGGPFGNSRDHCQGGGRHHDGHGGMGHDDDNGTFSYEDSITPTRLGARGAGAYKKGRRNTVVGHSTNLDETRMYQPQNQPKTQGEKDQLFLALSKCHLFAHLDEDEVHQVLGTMERCQFTRGQYVTKAGEVTETDSHKFFVVLEGEISVIEHNTVVRLLSSGSCFGESHIMFIQPRFMWTHRVDTTTALCFSLDANAYRHIVTRAAVNKRELYEGFLDRVSWLKGLDRIEKLQLADCLQPVVYPDGHYLIEYNTLGEWVFVILEGTVDVFGRDDQGEVLNVCSFAVGDCVGELEFINHHRTVADVRAKGRVKAARLHREHFEMCMGPIVDVLQRTAVADPRYAYYQTRIRTMRRVE